MGIHVYLSGQKFTCFALLCGAKSRKISAAGVRGGTQSTFLRWWEEHMARKDRDGRACVRARRAGKHHYYA